MCGSSHNGRFWTSSMIVDYPLWLVCVGHVIACPLSLSPFKKCLAIARCVSRCSLFVSFVYVTSKRTRFVFYLAQMLFWSLLSYPHSPLPRLNFFWVNHNFCVLLPIHSNHLNIADCHTARYFWVFARFSANKYFK